MAFNRHGAICVAGALLLSGVAVRAQVFQQLSFLHGAAYPGMHASGQGYLGVDIRGVGDPVVSSLHLKESHGVVVVMVDHDGPAWKAGIREHDVIYSVNGVAAENEEQLRRTLRDMKPGRTVQIAVSRDGSPLTMNATMANVDEVGRQAWEQHWVVPAPSDATADESTPPSQPSRPLRSFAHGFVSGHLLPSFTAYTGVTVNEIEPQLAEFFGIKGGKGLLVQSVDANSPAATAGLHAGDVVTRLNGTHMATRSDWSKALRDSKGHPVSMTVIRDHHEQVLTMVPDAKKRSSVDGTGVAAKPRWLAVLLPL